MSIMRWIVKHSGIVREEALKVYELALARG